MKIILSFLSPAAHLSPARRFIARSACILFIALAMGSCQEEENVLYEILDKIDQIAELGTWQNTVNGNIGALQTIVAAQQGNVYVTGMEKFDAPAPGGYTINFTDGTKATVKHNADSTAGATGTTPQIGVKDDGGSYYWTLNGTWLTGVSGNKIPVAGDHSITPQLRINLEADYYWEICTTGACDEEAGWTSLGIRTLDDDDEIRPQGDIVFAENGINEQAGYVEFILADGVTKIKVSKYVTDFPPAAASTRTWTFGSSPLIWSDVIQIPECDKDDFKYGHDPQCRSYTSDKLRFYYNWFYVYTNAARLCPSPWHVPSPEEFNTLISNVPGNNLKGAWGYGGQVHEDGSVGPEFVYNTSYYWSSNASSLLTAYALRNTSASMRTMYYPMTYGFQVRCVK